MYQGLGDRRQVSICLCDQEYVIGHEGVCGVWGMVLDAEEYIETMMV